MSASFSMPLSTESFQVLLWESYPISFLHWNLPSAYWEKLKLLNVNFFYVFKRILFPGLPDLLTFCYNGSLGWKALYLTPLCFYCRLTQLQVSTSKLLWSLSSILVSIKNIILYYFNRHITLIFIYGVEEKVGSDMLIHTHCVITSNKVSISMNPISVGNFCGQTFEGCCLNDAIWQWIARMLHL